MLKNIKKRTIIIAIILFLIILSTNPGLIPFIPTTIKVQMLKSLNSLFGDVTQISQVIMINWITVFQLIIMILAVIVIRDIVDIILSRIKPNKKRWKTLVGLYINVSKYLFYNYSNNMGVEYYWYIIRYYFCRGKYHYNGG